LPTYPRSSTGSVIATHATWSARIFGAAPACRVGQIRC
jgi:hypothetical protein